MNGLHLIADLHDCRCAPGLLLDAPGLEAYCVDACQRHGLTVVGRLFHAFRDAQGQPAGVTGTLNTPGAVSLTVSIVTVALPPLPKSAAVTVPASMSSLNVTV